MNSKTAFLGFALLTLFPITAFAQEVQIVGQMKDVMWKGQLQGSIDLDTLTHKNHLYGMGPLEYLAGEILIMNGRSYQSTVLSDTSMAVQENFQIKAPFFAYAHIPQWKEQVLPDSILNLSQLEHYLRTSTINNSRPFFFRLSGMVEEAQVHVVNLPKGSTVSSPKEAHKGLQNYTLQNEEFEILGFFSTQHQSIFTHHDTFLHMHLLTADRKKMGHLDKAVFKKGRIKLFLPLP